MNPDGFCKCGCGKKTNVAKRTVPDKGHIKGQPFDYLAGHSQKGVDPFIRFSSHFDINDASGCFIWKAGKSRGGYGKFKVWKRTRLAHQWIHEQWFGKAPDGLQLDHLCRNPSCVNPIHLELVTCRENLMRGNTLQRFNSEKTHCKYGHEFTDENLFRDGNGHRQCRACSRKWQADYRTRKKGVLQ